MFNIYNNPSQDDRVKTAQNCREDIIDELGAIIQYTNHYYATDDQSAKATILDIMDEEKVHVGQLFGLLFSLDPDTKKYFEQGLKEFNDENKK